MRSLILFLTVSLASVAALARTGGIGVSYTYRHPEQTMRRVAPDITN